MHRVNIERVVATSIGRPTFLPSWPGTEPDPDALTFESKPDKNYVVVSVELAPPSGVRIVVYENPDELDAIVAADGRVPALFYTCVRDRLGV